MGFACPLDSFTVVAELSESTVETKVQNCRGLWVIMNICTARKVPKGVCGWWPVQ